MEVWNVLGRIPQISQPNPARGGGRPPPAMRRNLRSATRPTPFCNVQTRDHSVERTEVEADEHSRIPDTSRRFGEMVASSGRCVAHRSRDDSISKIRGRSRSIEEFLQRLRIKSV